MKALLLLTVFALQGEWITTENGRRVCRLAYQLETGKVLTPGFCVDWQPGFHRPVTGETFDDREGWSRTRPFQQPRLHTEQHGWIP